MRFQTQPRTAALAALCIALVVLILVEVRFRTQPSLGPTEFEIPPGASAEPQSTPVPFHGPEISIDAAIQWPLFSPARSQMPLTVAVEPTPVSAGFSLIGVAISPAERVVVLVPAGGGAPERLRQGESYEGWSAVSIEPDHVVFRRGEVEETIYLNFHLPAPDAPVAGDETVNQPEAWSGGEPPDREEAETTVGGGDGSANP